MRMIIDNTNPSTTMVKARRAIDKEIGENINLIDFILGGVRNTKSLGSTRYMFALGHDLLKLKKLQKDGFGKTLERLGIPYRSAQKWMKCADRFLDKDGEIANPFFSQFVPSALYELSVFPTDEEIYAFLRRMSNEKS